MIVLWLLAAFVAVFWLYSRYEAARTRQFIEDVNRIYEWAEKSFPTPRLKSLDVDSFITQAEEQAFAVPEQKTPIRETTDGKIREED